MKCNKIKIAIVLFLVILQGFSQEVLTKKQALEITLENNFGIKIANNNLEVAKIMLVFIIVNFCQLPN